MSYRVIVPKSAQKQLDSLPANVLNRVIEQLILLAENPRPPGVVKLKGYEDEYRIRIGDYRIRFEFRD